MNFKKSGQSLIKNSLIFVNVHTKLSISIWITKLNCILYYLIFYNPYGSKIQL